MFFNCRQCYKVFQVGEGEAPKASYKQQTTFTVNRQRAYQRVVFDSSGSATRVNFLVEICELKY